MKRKKIKGTLLSSSIFFIITLATFLSGQLIYFNTHLKTYHAQIDYNKARIMRNIAQSYQLSIARYSKTKI